jgi:hypothetical protein
MSYVNVQIDLSDIDTEDLIDAVERCGYKVLSSEEQSEAIENLNHTMDEIRNLYDAFLHWKDFGMKDSVFERDLKAFFKITIDEVVL